MDVPAGVVGTSGNRRCCARFWILSEEETRHLLRYCDHPGTFQNIVSTCFRFIGPEIIAAAWDRSTHRIGLREWLAEESHLILGNDGRSTVAIDTMNRLVFQRFTERFWVRAKSRPGIRDIFGCFWTKVREDGRASMDSQTPPHQGGAVRAWREFWDFRMWQDSTTCMDATQPRNFLGQCNAPR